MTGNKTTAGGRTTEAGMTFQAAVATWLAAYLLADMPIGERFGLPAATKLKSIQCETGEALDDVAAEFDDDGRLYVQCKTTMDLSKVEESPLGKTLAQLVSLVFKVGIEKLAEGKAVAVLAVSTKASGSLDVLEAACRQFDHGGSWSVVATQGSEAQRNALAVFAQHVRTAWTVHSPTPPTDEQLVQLTRSFRIRRFSEGAEGADWREAAGVAGRRLYGDEAAGAEPMQGLLALMRRVIRSGAPVDRRGLLRALRDKGHDDIRAPGYDRDVRSVQAYSDAERQRMRKHARLPITQDGVAIPRLCLTALSDAVGGGSLLVTGEPGAGKTGVLLTLADKLDHGPGPVIYLSVERFSGLTTRAQFKDELQLEFDLLDVLANWPGAHPGVLMIDALDASRGGPSEAVMTMFIADAVTRLRERWSVVASIRSFDLRNGRRFRDMMPGTPPAPDYAEAELKRTRHFHIPKLSPTELAALADTEPPLLELIGKAPERVASLLTNVFNLSLAAELLASGTPVDEIQRLATQSELIRAYEDHRLPGLALQRAVADTIAVMVRRKRLAVRAIEIPNDAIQEVLSEGVLVAAGDKVAFAHHVLFDHLAGRFYLAWDDTALLTRQISGPDAPGLMLAPAMRFALEMVWQADAPGHPKTWAFLADLCATANADPVAVSASLRTAAERVEAIGDVGGLCDLAARTANTAVLRTLIGSLARYVSLDLGQERRLSQEASVAWAAVAQAVLARADLLLVDAARILLSILSDHVDLKHSPTLSAFGKAARSLLDACWSLTPENPQLTTVAIRLVTRSFKADPGASRQLLERILEPSRFKEHAPEEAPWLAEGVRDIIPCDPAFAARIYDVLFGHEVTDTRKTWFGGSPSRLLPLTSTPKQEYEHARWRLEQSLKLFLDTDASEGTRAVVGAARGLVAANVRELRREIAAPTLSVAGVTVIDDKLSVLDWREEGRRGHKDGKVFSIFVKFLRAASSAQFRAAVGVAIVEVTPAAIWARILGVAAERDALADDLLWPLVASPKFGALRSLCRDAVFFLVAAYPRRSMGDRETFEMQALATDLFPDERQGNWWHYMLARFLSLADEPKLATPQMRARRQQLAAAGKLRGNPPLMSVRAGWRADDDDVVESLLRQGGADLERSPDREIREATRKIESKLKGGPKEEPTEEAISALWADIIALIGTLDDGLRHDPHEKVYHAGWGAVGNAVERIAGAAAYAPDKAAGHPDLAAFLGLIERLARSKYPQSSNESSGETAWESWDVRVYAASSLVELAPRFAGEAAQILASIASLLSDPVPAVRLQVAQNLNVLWEVARDAMWAMVERVAADERHPSVLRFFITGTLERLKGVGSARCDRLLSAIIDREWSAAREVDEADGAERDFDEAANMVAWLYVARGEPLSKRWLERWAGDLLRGGPYLIPTLHDLREVFFFPFTATPAQEGMYGRARELLNLILVAVGAVLSELPPKHLPPADDATTAEWLPRFRVASQLLEEVCNQLYFGSGASNADNAQGETGLSSVEAKQRFLLEYSQVLDVIAAHAQGRTIHHLVELYAFLVDGDPDGIFGRIVTLLLQRGAADGYQYETLASDALVKLIRCYLAEHRAIFNSPARQADLVRVLELFATVGWPEATKLLFELPDLLR